LTDKELVLRKIAQLREHVQRARRRRRDDLAALAADVDLQDALVLSVMVALQEAIDIAFHIAADEGWGLPASNADAFVVLGTHAVIEPAKAMTLATTARLRNRIAHGYATLELERLWRELPDGLSQLEEFATSVGKWMDTIP